MQHRRLYRLIGTRNACYFCASPWCNCESHLKREGVPQFAVSLNVLFQILSLSVIGELSSEKDHLTSARIDNRCVPISAFIKINEWVGPSSHCLLARCPCEVWICLSRTLYCVVSAWHLSQMKGHMAEGFVTSILLLSHYPLTAFITLHVTRHSRYMFNMVITLIIGISHALE